MTGTMANFFVAKDHAHNDRLVGVKILDIEKMELFESRFKGLKKPSEGEIALSMKHPNVVETYEVGVSLKGATGHRDGIHRWPQLAEHRRSEAGRARRRQTDQPDPRHGRGAEIRPSAGLHSPRHLPPKLHLPPR